MRDISHKFTTLRSATARATLKICPETFKRFQRQDLPKGDPLPVARIAAIQAAKQTDRIIPYCHPIPVEAVEVDFSVEPESIHVWVSVKAVYKTGVEMEALTAASVAALTLYDMLKMIDEDLEIANVHLISKEGGKSGVMALSQGTLTASVLVISDSVSKGEGSDQSGQLMMECLRKHSVEVIDYQVISDEQSVIIRQIEHYADRQGVNLIMTTGGTGLGPRDNTPEAISLLLDKEVPGLSEMLRAYGQARTPYAMLSRAKAGLRGNSLIISLPGSRNAVQDAMEALFPYVLHVFHILKGGKHLDAENTESLPV